MQKLLSLFNMQHCINRRSYEEIEWNDSPVPKKPFLERYNRFLTIWMIAMIVLIIVAIGVQIFL